ncbi:MAG: hypothetical protein ACI4OS_00850 [Akkermansia sp.]
MKSSVLLCFAAALAAAMPLHAAKPKPAASAAAQAEGEELDAPKTGPRFVLCSVDGSTLPSPLYYKAGKTTFRSVRLGGRIPSPRIRPENGVINFYETEPTLVPGAKDTADLPKPVLTVNVNVSGKTLGIIIPTGGGKANVLFIEEKDFPKQGQHLINLSPYPLKITTSTKNDFSDKKEHMVGVFRRDTPVTRENSWSFSGENGSTVSFILSYRGKDAKEFKSFKASRFSIASDKSQITLIVRDPKRDAPKMLSIDLGKDSN